MATKGSGGPGAPAPDDVFDTAAPPPPQAYVRGPGSPAAPPAPPPAAPPVVGPAPAGAGAATGPWFTCGLGAGLLAQSPFLFGLAVLLTYSLALGVLAFLLVLLLGCCGAGCSGCGLERCGCDGCCGGCCGGGGSCCDCGGCGCGGCDCGGCDCGCATLPPVAGATLTQGAGCEGRLARRAREPLSSLAHHPDLPEFEQDVVRFGATRVCVGCLTVYPAFLAAMALLGWLRPGWPWAGMLLAGLALAVLQAVSSLGRARSRRAKVLVKSALGIGLALAVQALVAAPWPRLGRVAALSALLVLAWLSAQPRRRRIAAAVAARPFPEPLSSRPR